MSRDQLMLLMIISIVAAIALVNLGFAQNVGGPPVPSGPASIKITNFSVPETIGSNSPLYIFVELQNNGGLATTGNVTLNINVNGPTSQFNATYNVSALSPYQSESMIVVLHRGSSATGEHNVTVNASYISGGVLQYTKSFVQSYDVVTLQSPPSSNSMSIAQSQDLEITYVPIYTALYYGGEIVSEIGMKNTGSSPEFVNISVSRNYSDLITLSTSNLYLEPGSSLYMQFVLKAKDGGANVATYDIPINFSVNPVGGVPSSVTESIAFVISNVTQSRASVLNEVTLINSTNSTSGIIEVRSGSNTSINNATMVTYLPKGIVENASSIKTNGLQANISQNNGSYQINWFIPYLPAGQVQYAYYQISRLEGPQFPFHISTLLTMPSILKPLSILKIVNFSLPTFYTNSIEKMSVDVLYTGTGGQGVYFYLTAPPGVSIYNATQVVNATPNQLLSRDFIVKTGGTPGTMIFTLYINTQGTNITYSLPIVTLQGSQIGASTTTIKAVASGTTKPVSINIKDYMAYIIAAVAILLIVLLIYGVMVIMSRPNYNRKRIRKLMDVKDQIKRQGGNIG